MIVLTPLKRNIEKKMWRMQGLAPSTMPETVGVYEEGAEEVNGKVSDYSIGDQVIMLYLVYPRAQLGAYLLITFSSVGSFINQTYHTILPSPSLQDGIVTAFFNNKWGIKSKLFKLQKDMEGRQSSSILTVWLRFIYEYMYSREEC